MRITMAAVGRARDGPTRALFDLYRNRLTWPFTLKEIEEKSRLPQARRLDKQGEALLASIPQGARIVALDETGQQLSSTAFAHCLEGWQTGGTQGVAFLIGGADGLADKAKTKADLVLALGRMTWPHLLVRGLLLEQLYRAETILKGHPYHRA